jgi:hypothetical protein
LHEGKLADTIPINTRVTGMHFSPIMFLMAMGDAMNKVILGKREELIGASHNN